MADDYNAGRAARIVKPNIHTDDSIRAVYLEHIQGLQLDHVHH